MCDTRAPVPTVPTPVQQPSAKRPEIATVAPTVPIAPTPMDRLAAKRPELAASLQEALETVRDLRRIGHVDTLAMAASIEASVAARIAREDAALAPPTGAVAHREPTG